MRIENLAGDSTWRSVAVPVDSATYEVQVQNLSSVAVDLRFTNNPTETWLVKADSVLTFPFIPRETNQLEVWATSGTIQVMYQMIRY